VFSLNIKKIYLPLVPSTFFFSAFQSSYKFYKLIDRVAEGCCFYFARPHCSAAGLVRHIPGVPNILTPKLLRKLKTSEIFGHLL